MVLGIARGDSSLRALGERIATVAEYRSRTKLIHRLANGETVQYKPKQPGHEKWLAQSGGKVQNLHFHWLQSPSRIPLYMGGYGPRALRVAGELADAVVVQAIDNEIVRWALDHTHEGARQAGRNPSDIRMVVSGPVVVSNDVKKARNDLRWFVQAIWNHVSDVLEHHDRSTLPANLVLGLPVDFRSDYSEHVQREAEELAHSARRGRGCPDNFRSRGALRRATTRAGRTGNQGVHRLRSGDAPRRNRSNDAQLRGSHHPALPIRSGR